MFGLISLFKKPLTVPVLYFEKPAPRKMMGVEVVDDGFQRVVLALTFQRPVEKTDFKNGAFIPPVTCKFKRRGGKVSTTVCLTYESAEALHKSLGRALKDARHRRFWHRLNSQIFSYALESALR